MEKIEKNCQQMMNNLSVGIKDQVIIQYNDMSLDDKVLCREHIRDNYPEPAYYEFVELIIQ